MSSLKVLYLAGMRFSSPFPLPPSSSYLCLRSRVTGNYYIGRKLIHLPILETSVQDMIEEGNVILKRMNPDPWVHELLSRCNERPEMSIFLSNPEHMEVLGSEAPHSS